MEKNLSLFLLIALMLLGSCKEQPEPKEQKNTKWTFEEPNETKQTIGGHEYVDLGLPSGTLWATCNVGAQSPEDPGDYFAWGEIQPKSEYSWSTYKYGSSSTEITKYGEDVNDGLNGYSKVMLDAEDDAATANLGSLWRMPTDGELIELLETCLCGWTEINYEAGMKFSGPNGNSLFLPAAGRIVGTLNSSVGRYCIYWSKTAHGSGTGGTIYLNEGSVLLSTLSYPRIYGMSVRPVVDDNLSISATSKCMPAKGGTFSVSVDTKVSWTVSANQPWVTFSTNGENGSGSVEVHVAANEANVSDNATVTVKTSLGNRVQTLVISRAATIGGHDYVDLGLPSGTLWAISNVGANSVEDYGDYFAWGESLPKSEYSWSTYQYGIINQKLTKYCNMSSYGLDGFVDNKMALETLDDVAATWGISWRMPTVDELRELVAECTSVWTTQGGVHGRLYTGSNGNFIFLPATGCYQEETMCEGVGVEGDYWSSTLHKVPDKAGSLYIDDSRTVFYARYRTNGLAVRAVVRQ
ncbi:MAG: BACON domain-containing protein [Paludibacteraceae bacterium]|nr:BACON domain-containing protein [Paludibacteraceae bacterium]